MADYYFAASTGGFYNSDFNSDIPNDAIALDRDLYQALALTPRPEGAVIVINVDTGLPVLSVPPSSYHRWGGAGWILDEGAAAQHLLALRARQLAVINATAAQLLNALSSSYPDGEVQSWAQQTREAEALSFDPSAAAPLLTVIAAARALTIADLAARVRAKEAAYAAASGATIGQRQALEDRLMAVDLQAPDAAEQLEAIQWPA
ncbi:hypothetical protein NK214_06350 [Chromobacterium sp. S0633]|uniref:hypothetical protein n=1 Tax=Chromobacterium sp. S0633 TaxID=2957805 RepID=UPI00209FB0DF|nr:hypothetical protein [Chromobacterium sp. S0633]MCP1289809.1 hypothetical protein [Chromobacterium sp. S0633]